MASKISRDMQIGIVIGSILFAEKPDTDSSIKALMHAWSLTNAHMLHADARAEIENILARAVLAKRHANEGGQ